MALSLDDLSRGIKGLCALLIGLEEGKHRMASIVPVRKSHAVLPLGTSASSTQASTRVRTRRQGRWLERSLMTSANSPETRILSCCLMNVWRSEIQDECPGYSWQPILQAKQRSECHSAAARDGSILSTVAAFASRARFGAISERGELQSRLSSKHSAPSNQRLATQGPEVRRPSATRLAGRLTSEP